MTLDRRFPERLAVYFPRAGDLAADALVQYLSQPAEQYRLAIYSLNHPAIVAAIQAMIPAGTPVRLMTDKVQALGPAQLQALDGLFAAGVPIKVNHHAGLMHLKMAVRGEPARDLAFGSFNWTHAAQYLNDEILAVVINSKMAQRAAAVFDGMWEDAERFSFWVPPTPQQRASLGLMPPSPY